MASNSLPESQGQPISSPPLDSSGVPSAPVGSPGTVTLGAGALNAAQDPVSVVQPELVVPSINPPPLGARAHPLNPGPMIVPASLSAEPEISSRSSAAAPPVVAPDDSPVPDPQAAPPSGPAGSADYPQPGTPEPPDNGTPGDDDSGNDDSGDGGPDDGDPGDDDPGDGDPGDSGPDNGTPGDGGPGVSAPDSYTQSARSADTPDSHADQSARPGHSDHKGGRHRR